MIRPIVSIFFWREVPANTPCFSDVVAYCPVVVVRHGQRGGVYFPDVRLPIREILLLGVCANYFTDKQGI
jgi:hypothetical protein